MPFWMVNDTTVMQMGQMSEHHGEQKTEAGHSVLAGTGVWQIGECVAEHLIISASRDGKRDCFCSAGLVMFHDDWVCTCSVSDTAMAILR
jgi:hypothetical protein